MRARYNVKVTDAGRRMSDVIDEQVNTNSVNSIGRWMAFRLSDGTTDGVLYDTRDQAVKHQLHEYQCCYVQLLVDGMSPQAASRYLEINRLLYSKGFRLTDPQVHHGYR